MTYAIEALVGVVVLAFLVIELRTPLGPIDTVDEALRLRYRAGVSK